MLAQANPNNGPIRVKELQRLESEVLDLGSMVEIALVGSVDMLKRRDLAGAQQLITLHRRINKKRFTIEMDCLTLIVTQQPLDGDLRVITSMMEIVSELERMGEYSRDIARTPFMVIDGPLLALLVDIHAMATKTQGMLHRALQAFHQRDLVVARAIPAEDGDVDALYSRVYQDLLAFMKDNAQAKGNSRAMVNQGRYLGRMARNLERIADQVAHICGWVAFAVAGEMEVMETDSAPVVAEHAVNRGAEYVPSEVPEASRGESQSAA